MTKFKLKFCFYLLFALLSAHASYAADYPDISTSFQFNIEISKIPQFVNDTIKLAVELYEALSAPFYSHSPKVVNWPDELTQPVLRALNPDEIKELRAFSSDWLFVYLIRFQKYNRFNPPAYKGDLETIKVALSLMTTKLAILEKDKSNTNKKQQVAAFKSDMNKLDEILVPTCNINEY